MIDDKTLRKIPASTGIYLFKKGEEYLYIGKAKNLRARIKTHKLQAKVNKKEALIFNQASKVEWITTDSEFNAILLEAKLIREKQPKYNVRWRDDKSHLYIKITKADDYPKVFLSRKENDGQSLYFGPFLLSKVAYEILRLVRQIVPFCTQKKISKRPCFYSKINLCQPCPSYIESLDDKNIRKRLKKKYQENIKKVIKILSGNSSYLLKQYEKILKSLIEKQKYEEAIVVRNRYLKLRKLILEKSFNLAEEEEKSSWKKTEEKIRKILGNFFNLRKKRILRIEGFDISNFSFKEAVGAMVIFFEGSEKKDQYRRFRIKNSNLKDDFSMLVEVLRRRLSNKSWGKPDLLLIDGGKPQLLAIWKSLSQMINVPILGIAKEPDRLIVGRPPFEEILNKEVEEILPFFQKIRDEAHRFAKKYHQYLREKKLNIKLCKNTELN